MNQVSATVIDNELILQGIERPHARTILSVRYLWLRCPEIAFVATPGQFVMVKCGPECTLARPLSIHAVRGEAIALYFNVLEDGKGTGWLAQRKVDERVELYGPLGNGFQIDADAFNLLLVAGGIGIAPLRFLAQEALRGGRTVTLLVGAQTATQLYPDNLLPSGITGLAVTTEDGSAGKKGMVTSLLPDFVGWADQVFACGPMPMYHDMATKYGQLLKDKPVQVSLEVRMGCGLGFCYACTVKTKIGLKQVCKDGPVFNLDDILPKIVIRRPKCHPRESGDPGEEWKSGFSGQARE